MKKNKTDPSHQELLIGRKPVIDALSAQIPISTIWIDRTLRGKEEIEIRQLAQTQSIPLKPVARQILIRKTKSNHQGVIAVTSPIRFHDLENIIQHVFDQGLNPLLLYLDRIQDVGNFGSIDRTRSEERRVGKEVLAGWLVECGCERQEGVREVGEMG